MNPHIYVDGQEGTTGLRIHEYLAARPDLDVLRIDHDKRKDPAERRRLLNAADVVFLCLPEAASREAVALIDNPRVHIIDASTAFRTDDSWIYGLPELPGQRDKLRGAGRGQTGPGGGRVANPGCHATAFLLAVRPLVDAGILPPDASIACCSLTGYSGAGRKMIEKYEAPDAPAKLRSPRYYALGMQHKHLPEMLKFSGLARSPVFTPVICNVHTGLAVETFFPAGLLSKSAGPAQVHDILAAAYGGEPFVRVMPFTPDAGGALDEGCLDITACNGTNRAELFVFGHDDRIAVIARLDNLGKGAGGSAIQNMNLLLGLEETTGLVA